VGVDFDDVVHTAGVVHEVLDDLGWAGFPKTSGGRGVHVYLRIAPRWSFVEVRRAAIDDALLRAREYAEAVGARIDRLIEIADEGTVQHFAMRASAGADIDIEVDPQPQIVQASVTVRVTITEPTLPG